MTEPTSEDLIEILIELTEKFTHKLSMEEVLQEITDALLRILPGTHSSIRILNDTRTELLSGARSGQGASARPMVFRKGEGIAGWVADYGRAARINDVSADPRFKPGRDQGFAIGSILVVPVQVGDGVVGVMAMTSPDAGVYSQQHEILAQLLANCSVPVIEKARLERMAPFDELTLAFKERGLLPRLQDEMDRSREQGTRLSILLLDLDHLRQVYMEHDFSVGDAVLRAFADRVRALCQPSQRLYRRGGGNFVLILPQTDTVEARRQAELIRADFEERPVELEDGTAIEQRVSIGVATFLAEQSVVDLIQSAEQALQMAKDLGRNKVMVAEKNILAIP